MIISASPPLGVPNSEQSGDPSAQAISANPGGDFSAFLFLMLATSQVQNIHALGEPQLGAKGTDSVVLDAQGTLCAASLCPDQTPVARSEEIVSPVGQVVSNQGQEPLAPLLIASVSAQIHETVVGTPATNSIQPALGESQEASSPVGRDVSPPAEKKITLPAGDSVASPIQTLFAVTDQNLVTAAGQLYSPASGAIGQKELNTPSAKNLALSGDPGQNVGASLNTASDVSGPRDQKITNDPADANADKITLGVPLASVLEIDSRQTLTKEAAVTEQDAGLPSQEIHPVTKDAQLDKPWDISDGLEISGSEKTSGNFEIIIHAPKTSGTQDQNSASAFEGHGEKTLDQVPERNSDHAAQFPNLSAVLPSIGMHDAESPTSADVKTPSSPVIDQVAGGIVTNVRQNKNEVVITLDPPELGSLKINLSLDDGKVQVHIIAEARESRSLIENHIPELKQALQLHRLDLVDVRVDSGNWNATTGDLMHGFQREPNGRQAWGEDFGSPWQPASERPETQGSDTASPPTGRVSMWA